MRKMKKLLSILVAATMTLAMAAPSFADDPKPENTITITNATAGYKYDAYKILDATIPAEAANSNIVAYTVTPEWENFLRTDPAAQAVFEVDDKGYVKAKPGITDNSDAMKAFAQAAKANISDKPLAGTVTPEETIIETEMPDGTISTTTKTDDLTVTIDVTDHGYGYYLVNSAVGTLCALDSNTPNVTFEDKSNAPSLEKTVAESEAQTAAKVQQLSTEIGKPLYFEVVVKAQPGAASYVLTDTMTDGLTFTGNVKINGNDAGDAVTNSSDRGFTLTIPTSYYENIERETVITITYQATVNGDAIKEDVSKNTATLEYGNPTGETVHTPSSEVEITVNSFRLNKVIRENGVDTAKPLTGAEFKLYENAEKTEGETPLNVVAVEGGYRVAENASESGVTDTIVAGSVVVDGLKAGNTYYLEETKAPDGYNRMTERKPITIAADNTALATVGNSAGQLLPSTGGIGTTIFYAAGIILMAGAVFFVVRRRRA